MFIGLTIIIAMTIISVIAMMADLHDMQSQVKYNTDKIRGMHELIHGKDK